MAAQGRGRDRHRRRPRPAARGRHGAVRDHGLRVPGADALRRRAGAGRRGPRGLREVGGPRHGDRRGHRHAARCGSCAAARWSATCPSRRSSTTARSTTSPRAVRPSRCTRRRRRGSLAGDAAARRRCSRCSPRRTSRRAARSSSSTTASCSRARSARPEQADAAVLALPDRRRDRRLDRRQRPPRGRRPVPRDGRGGARVRRQPRLRRRRAARPDQLPELRQPREAARRLAADRVGARPRRRLPRARASRSSAATSRSTTRAPTGRSTRRRWSGWSASCPIRWRAALGLRPRGRRLRASPATARPSLAASELAKLRGEPLPDGLADARPRGQAIDVLEAVREAVRAGRARAPATTSPRAAAWWRWPRPAWPAASARGSRCEGEPRTRSSSARSPAGSWSPASAPRWSALGERRNVQMHIFGTVGGDALELGGGAPWTLERAARGARRRSAPLFP